MDEAAHVANEARKLAAARRSQNMSRTSHATDDMQDRCAITRVADNDLAATSQATLTWCPEA